MRDVFELAEAAIHEALSQQWRDFERVRELSDEEWLRRGECPTEFHSLSTADYADERGLKTKMNQCVWKTVERRGLPLGLVN